MITFSKTALYRGYRENYAPCIPGRGCHFQYDFAIFSTISVQFALLFLIVLVLKETVIELYVVPTTSMENNILKGDMLVGSRFTYGMKVPPVHGPTGAQLEIRSLDTIAGYGERAQLRWTPTKVPQTLTYVAAGTTHNFQAGFNAEVTCDAATTKLTLAYDTTGVEALNPGDYGTIKVTLAGTALSGGATINLWYAKGSGVPAERAAPNLLASSLH